MEKQTAVEWLVKMLYSPVCVGFIQGKRQIPHDIINQAKEMEKQQIQLIYASRCSFISCEGSTAEELTNCNCGKRYYNETFKSQ